MIDAANAWQRLGSTQYPYCSLDDVTNLQFFRYFLLHFIFVEIYFFPRSWIRFGLCVTIFSLFKLHGILESILKWKKSREYIYPRLDSSQKSLIFRSFLIICFCFFNLIVVVFICRLFFFVVVFFCFIDKLFLNFYWLYFFPKWKFWYDRHF